MNASAHRWAALAALLSTGCFTVSPRESVEKIAVQSTPPGALVTVTDQNGSKAIGRTPLEAEVTVVRHQYQFDAVASWLLTGASLAATGLCIWLSVDTPNDSTIGRIFAISGATTFGIVGLIGLPASIVGQGNDGEVVSTEYKHGVPSFEGTLDGYTDAWVKPGLELVPPDAPLVLQLTQHDGSAIVGALVESPVKTRPVLAIFDLDPGNSGVKNDIADQLSDYLTAKLAGGGRYRVVPRSQLRQRLAGEKTTSYRDCFDENCQIELGKAVAAEKTLAAKLIRVGDTCALTATVFDLRSEAADAAETVRTACEQNGLMDAIDAVADRLSAQ